MKGTLDGPRASPRLCPLREKGQAAAPGGQCHRCLDTISLQPSFLLKAGFPLYTTFSALSLQNCISLSSSVTRGLGAHTVFRPPCLYGKGHTGAMPVTEPIVFSLPRLLVATGWADNSLFPEILSPALWHTTILFLQPNCSFSFQLTGTVPFAFFPVTFFFSLHSFLC